MNVLFVDSIHQPTEFSSYVCWSTKRLLQQQGLEPTIEVLDRTVVFGHARGDEDDLDAQTQAKTNNPAEIASRMAEATEFATVVELDLRWQSQVLPGVHQKPQDQIHSAAVDELHIDGLIKGVLADQEVVSFGVSFQIAWTDDIDLMDLVGVLSTRAWVLAPSQLGRKSQRRASQPSSSDDPLNGAQAGQGRVPQSFQFSPNLRCSYSAVPGLRRCSRSQSASDADDRLFDVGWRAIDHSLICSGQVVEPFWSQCQIAFLPLVEPAV